MTAKKITLTAANGADMTAEITNFASIIGLERAAPDRCSMLLVLGLFGGVKSGHLNPAKVVHEIQALEGIGNPSRLKPPTQFKDPPLKGLWHKHYLPDGLLSKAINIKNGLKLRFAAFRPACQVFADSSRVLAKAAGSRALTVVDRREPFSIAKKRLIILPRLNNPYVNFDQ